MRDTISVLKDIKFDSIAMIDITYIWLQREAVWCDGMEINPSDAYTVFMSLSLLFMQL